MAKIKRSADDSATLILMFMCLLHILGLPSGFFMLQVEKGEKAVFGFPKTAFDIRKMPQTKNDKNLQ